MLCKRERQRDERISTFSPHLFIIFTFVQLIMSLYYSKIILSAPTPLRTIYRTHERTATTLFELLYCMVVCFFFVFGTEKIVMMGTHCDAKIDSLSIGEQRREKKKKYNARYTIIN